MYFCQGGLSVRQLAPFNQALLSKWLWRYATEKDVFWRKVVECQYSGRWRGWCIAVSKGQYGVCLWKYIRSGFNWFAQCVNYSVGNRIHVHFWSNQWCGDGVLIQVYLELYGIAQDKGATMVDYLQWEGCPMMWDVSSFRPLQDWEMKQLTSFMELIQSSKVRRGAEDQIRQQYTKSGLFEVKSLYNALCSGIVRSFPWKSIWRVKDPLKVVSFTWTTALGKILILDNFNPHQVVVVEWCFLCKKAWESVDHLLLHYEYA